MKNKNYDLDALLGQVLGGTEKPAPALLYKIKNSEERDSMKNKRFMKPSMALAAAIITALSLTVIAVAGSSIWRYLETRVIEGGEFVTDLVAAVSDDGLYSLQVVGFDREALDAAEHAVIIAEIEGERVVLRDELRLDNLDEAINLSVFGNFLMPSYLPEGFAFAGATFPVNPIAHPCQYNLPGSFLFLDFANGDEIIRMMVQDYGPFDGFPVFSETQTDIIINGDRAAVADGMLGLVTGDVLYFISGELARDELIRIAESLR